MRGGDPLSGSGTLEIEANRWVWRESNREPENEKPAEAGLSSVLGEPS